jgi:hypothetical protein
MTSMDELLKALQEIDPLWSVALVGLALVVLLTARLWRASFGRALALGATAILVAVVLGGAYYGYLHLEDLRRLEERRALEERAASLFSQTMQPGTVFACLDGSPAPAMLEACERIIFMEPQRVAAAVSIVTQRLAFLADALQFASKRDPSYLARVESLRNSIETDAYGFVAYVLSLDYRCTPDSCERFQLLRDPSRVRENLRVRRFEAFMVKHSPAWREAAPPVAVRESPLPPGGTRPSVSGVSFGDPVSASEAAASAARTPPPQPGAQPQVTVPAAALAPEVTPPTEVAPETTPAAAVEPPPAPAAKSPPAKSAPPAAAKGAPPPAAPKAAPKAKATSDPAVKRTSEPVAGLPRVVPRDYIRDKEEEATTQAAGQPTTGAPIPIGPQQNFTGR